MSYAAIEQRNGIYIDTITFDEIDRQYWKGKGFPPAGLILRSMIFKANRSIVEEGKQLIATPHRLHVVYALLNPTNNSEYIAVVISGNSGLVNAGTAPGLSQSIVRYADPNIAVVEQLETFSFARYVSHSHPQTDAAFRACMTEYAGYHQFYECD
jgi:hypothetical protein